MLKRRDFIRKASAIGGLSLLSKISFGQSQTASPEKVRYAVVGLGFFASYVIPRIQASSHSKVTALISSDNTKSLEWSKKYRIPEKNLYRYEDLSWIANNDDIDAVYIATPVGTHAQFALEALRAGKHVIVEKTMAGSVQEAEAMIAAAKTNNRKLMVAYRARYEPYNQQAIKFARDKTFGKVTSITAHKGFMIGDKLGKGNWRTNRKLASGGALVDIGIYSIQACRYIAGAEPVEVFAFQHSPVLDSRFAEVEESLSFMLKFPDGLLATGSASWNYNLQNYYRVGAEQGNYVLDPATSNQNLRLTVNTRQPRISSERFLRNIDQIDAQFGHFSDCILNDKAPLTPGEEGLKDLVVIEALYRSVSLGQPVSIV